MKVKLIINPMSGLRRGRIPPLRGITWKHIKQIYVPKKSTSDIIKEVEEALNGNVSVRRTLYPKHAIKLAKEAAKDKYDIVIAAGGDGTINEVVNGLAGTKASLGLLPLGTANVLAMELGIPFDTKKCCKIIAKGKKKKIDVGKVTIKGQKRYFSMLAGIGFDAYVAKKVRPLIKKLFGSFAYPLTAFHSLWAYNFPEITVNVDGKEIKGYYVVVGNTKYFGGEFRIAHKAQLDDGLLDVVIFRQKNAINMIRYIVLLAADRLRKAKTATYLRVKKLNVKSKEGVLVHTDAELVGNTPAKIEVVEKGLSVVVK